MNKKIKFFVNNTRIETDVPPASVLLDLLRKDFKGVKEVCREGDCGGCTVLLGEKINGKPVYKTIASCLTPVGNVEGKHVVTIEGVNRKNCLNPVQEEFLKEGASQCGFCTPGFILSLTGFFLNSKTLSYEDAVNAMDGNICRCTGYQSIKRAAKNLSDKYGKLLDTNKDRIEQLVEWEILPEYFISINEKLAESTSQKLVREKGSVLIAGGTDLFVQRADILQDEQYQFTGMDKNLSFVNDNHENIIIGGNTTITELIESPVIAKYLPWFKKTSELISSTIIRNAATVSGNLVNASPIGDIAIILLSLDAELVLSDSRKTRNLMLKNFYSAYKTFDLKDDEYIKEIKVKAPDSKSKFNLEKVSKRKYLDIASVNSAILIKTAGRKIEELHISAGGVWPYPLYLLKTEEFLTGKEISPDIIRRTAEIIASETAPIDDIRGKASYKSLLLKQLFYAHFITLYPEYIKMEDLV
jgi:xanthine dehydrogenase small subunit